MKIGNKLLITYMILLATVLVVTGTAFRVLLHRYLVNEAKGILKSEARAVAATLEKIPIREGELRPNLLAKRQMRINGQFIDSKAIVLSNDNKIIYSNLEEKDKKVLQALVNNKRIKAAGYVSEREPILSKNGEVKGYVLLFTKVDDIRKLSRVMDRTQLLSLIMGGVAAVILGMVFQRGLTRPIGKLKAYMSRFSLKNAPQEFKIETGDEIQELAECFESMVQRLKAYDVQQKRFLQNSSHELKTPLMSIQGYAEAIKDGIVEGDELQQSLDVIIDESRRLKRVVDEMIYLAKLDNVEETFHFENTGIQEIIEQSIRSVKALADAKGLELVTEGNGSCSGAFDREKLERALINILSNCIRYAEKEITIKWEARNEAVEIIITDDGPGFKPGEENKVFERFYKGEKGGTGIGLAIVKAIIAGHNGRVKADNAVPKGAEFRIVLPGK